MQSEQSFEVAAPLEQVWAALVDLERVVPCLPGASLGSHNPDGSYDGEFKVKIGPTSASYEGRLNVEAVDDAGHSTTLQAAGTDKRGQGGARATIVTTAASSEAGTRVAVASDYHITGRLARFGRGGTIDEIAERLIADFADALRRMLADDSQATVEISALEAADLGTPALVPEAPVELPVTVVEPLKRPAATPPPAPEPPVSTPGDTAAGAGEALVPASLWDRTRANPGPAAALVFGFLVALRVLRRRS